MSKLIPLTQGQFAIIDDTDYDWLNQSKWYYNNSGYAARRFNGEITSMHRIITNAPEGLVVDHINGNRLDNQRNNLRICTQQENTRNRKPVGASQYNGVTWHNQRNRWVVRIRINGKQTHVGIYDEETEAARAYDAAARKHYGEFARLNFPEITEGHAKLLLSARTHKFLFGPRKPRIR